MDKNVKWQTTEEFQYQIKTDLSFCQTTLQNVRHKIIISEH